MESEAYFVFSVGLTAEEFLSMDPKDGELYLSRVKPGEILVEARFNTDVQIVCRT
jgi:hypothetical protein